MEKRQSLSLRIAPFLLACSAAFAAGAKKPITQAEFAPYENYSLQRFAELAGTSPNTLRGFADKIRQSSGQGNVGHGELTRCLGKLAHNTEGRNALVGCLGSIGRAALNQDLMFELEDQLAALYPQQGKVQIQKTIFLLGYVEDLIRENRAALHQSAHWFYADRGFVKNTGHSDFPFENGDVGLAMGNTSISSLISQVTAPVGRFSHAFFVKDAGNGVFNTLESEVQSGVEEYRGLKHFAEYPYNEVWVSRWNGANRKQITDSAIAWATQKAAIKTQYDFAMDMTESKKIFCSELVISGLTQATGLGITDIVPTISQIKSDAVYGYISRVGIRNSRIPSPADLAGSRRLDVLAKYRNADSLIREWELYMMGDVLVDRLNRGAEFSPSPEFAIVPLPVYLLQLFPSMLSSHLRLIPKQISPDKIAVMATTELRLFKPAIKYVRKSAGDDPSMLQVSPWYVRGALDYWVDYSPGGRRHLYFKR